MSESTKTFSFLGAALLSVVVAWGTSPSLRQQPKDFSEVGKPFFPDFTNPNDAKSVEVVAYDEGTASASVFKVEYKDGVWKIPSHHNYPADGKERLAKAATSLLDLKREALVGRREAEYPDFGVAAPMGDTGADLKGRGNRITLKSESGADLVDLIIGKPVPGKTGYFYVRRPDEKQTYTAKLDIPLSTKFADWIEPDVLKLDGPKLSEILVEKYSFVIQDNGRAKMQGHEVNELSRAKSTDPWTLKELNTETEEVNQDEVRKLVTALDDLKIVGVRQKPAKLSKDLRLSEGVSLDPGTMLDLQSRGFYFIPTKNGEQMVSKEGDLIAMTDEGVVYEMHFGDVFTGSMEEVEIGGITKPAEDKPAEGEAKEGDTAKPEDPTQKKSRYLFVTTSFDASKIPGKPSEPVEPQAPGEQPPVDENASADALKAANTPEGEDPQRAYDVAKIKYEGDKTKYASDLKAWEAKVAAGEKKVAELNVRFADWYYVISAENFENLRQGRKTLVKEKGSTPPPAAGQPGANGLPPGLNLNLPN